MDTKLSAINAYQNTEQLLNNSSVSPAGSGNGNDFSNLVNNVLDETVTSLKHGEATASASLVSDVSLTELASAVNNAEIALKTVSAVRTRIISAYQDIMKMPI